MLKQRLLTAVVLAALLIGAIFFLPPRYMTLVLALLFAGGAWEWAGFLGIPRGVGRVPMVAAFGLAVALVEWARIRGHDATWLLWAGVVWWVIAFAWVTRFPTPMPRSVIVGCAFLTLLPAWYALARIHASPNLGALWLLFVFVLVWAADTGAFFAGRRFGRRKLAPRVSPGKTWAGVGGGVLVALVAGAVAALVLPDAPTYLPGLVIVCVAASIVGDLTVSMFKRHAGIKDSGAIFPGHGGILDRIDSLCGAAPPLALALALSGRVL